MKIFQLVDALPKSALQHKNVQKKFKFHQHIFGWALRTESRKTVVKNFSPMTMKSTKAGVFVKCSSCLEKFSIFSLSGHNKNLNREFSFAHKPSFIMSIVCRRTFHYDFKNENINLYNEKYDDERHYVLRKFKKK